MKLTQDNYFGKENKYLTNSKIGDFLRDKAYFKKKHIDCSLEFQATPSMIFGKQLDTLLTEGMTAFNQKYQVKVLKRDDPERFEYQKENAEELEFITLPQLNHVCAASNSISVQDCYKDLKDHQRQVILQVEVEDKESIWLGYAGMLDFLKIVGNKAIITDLKTTADIDKVRYHYSCEKYGYYRQMAMYNYLVRQNYPEVTTVEHRHLAVETGSGLYLVQTFTMDKAKIKEEYDKMQKTIYEILKEEKFAPQNLSWDNSVKLGYEY